MNISFCGAKIMQTESRNKFIWLCRGAAYLRFRCKDNANRLNLKWRAGKINIETLDRAFSKTSRAFWKTSWCFDKNSLTNWSMRLDAFESASRRVFMAKRTLVFRLLFFSKLSEWTLHPELPKWMALCCDEIILSGFVAILMKKKYWFVCLLRKTVYLCNRWIKNERNEYY